MAMSQQLSERPACKVHWWGSCNWLRRRNPTQGEGSRDCLHKHMYVCVYICMYRYIHPQGMTKSLGKSLRWEITLRHKVTQKMSLWALQSPQGRRQRMRQDGLQHPMGFGAELLSALCQVLVCSSETSVWDQPTENCKVCPWARKLSSGRVQFSPFYSRSRPQTAAMRYFSVLRAHRDNFLPKYWG